MPPAQDGPKRSRKRLRVSCVECAKRRQKCDRQLPCTRCTQRSVSHLCRYELEPYARPAPVRPPGAIEVHQHASKADDAESSKDVLQKRIAALERALAESEAELEMTRQRFIPSRPESSATAVDEQLPNLKPMLTPASINSEVARPRTLNMSQDDCDAAIALAELSLGNSQGDYFGTESIISALHKFQDGEEEDNLSVQSTSVIKTSSPIVARENPNLRLFSPPPCRELITSLPTRTESDYLIKLYFERHNWRFGVPEDWFLRTYNKMWSVVQQSPREANINVHWLFLVFGILAWAAQGVSMDLSETFFQHALRAQSLFDDAELSMALSSTQSLSMNDSSFAEGTVLSCLATPIVAFYISDRGLVGEGWKMVGVAVRRAFAVGMHRDPSWGKFNNMSEEEATLRRRGWWGLAWRDRLYSHVLGRPTMIQNEQFDVIGDGSVEGRAFDDFQAQMIKLSEVISIADKDCFGIHMPLPATVQEVDRLFMQWEDNLPAYFRLEPSTTPETTQTVGQFRQCCHLATWYLATRASLHRHFLNLIPPSVRSDPNVNLAEAAQHYIRSRDISLDLAVRLVEIHLLPSIRADDGDITGHDSRDLSCFDNVYFLFEAAVTLISYLRRFVLAPERVTKYTNAFHRAFTELQRRANENPNDTTGGERGWPVQQMARRAVKALSILKERQDANMSSKSTVANSNSVPEPDVSLMPPPSSILRPSVASTLRDRRKTAVASASVSALPEASAMDTSTSMVPSVQNPMTNEDPSSSFMNYFPLDEVPGTIFDNDTLYEPMTTDFSLWNDDFGWTNIDPTRTLINSDWNMGTVTPLELLQSMESDLSHGF